MTVWNIAKWPGMLAVVVADRRDPLLRDAEREAAALPLDQRRRLAGDRVWIIASAAFGLYVSLFSSYDKTYGAMAGVVVFLLWLWLTNLALLFGAELDCELERGRELQAGLAAEESLQLPARDTRTMRKQQRKREQDIARGRGLRESRGRSGDPES